MSSNIGLIQKLMLAQVSSCSCLTKTNEAAWHDTNCLYRVLAEAIETITKQDVEIERLSSRHTFRPL